MLLEIKPMISPNSLFGESITTTSQIVALIVSAIPAFVLVQNRWANSRKRLKDDLDILAKFNEQDNSYKIIKAYIDYRVKEIYKLPYKLKVYHKTELIIGIIYIIVFSLLAILTYDSHSWFWWTLTINYIFTGPIMIISSFRKTSWLYRYNKES